MSNRKAMELKVQEEQSIIVKVELTEICDEEQVKDKQEDMVADWEEEEEEEEDMVADSEEEEDMVPDDEDSRDADYHPTAELLHIQTDKLINKLSETKKMPLEQPNKAPPAEKKASRKRKKPQEQPEEAPLADKESSTKREKSECPLCHVPLWNVSKHLRSSIHRMSMQQSKRWRYTHNTTGMKKYPCPVAQCPCETTNVGQHLKKQHGYEPGTLPYAQLMRTNSKKARTMYSKLLTSVQQNSRELQVAIPLEIVNKQIWLEYDRYLKEHLGKTLASRRLGVLRPIKALQTVHRCAHLRAIFSQPIDDEDTAARKLEEKFLLPLLKRARADPRTASNAVNKVRDLERFLQYLVDRKALFLQQKCIHEEEIRRVLSIIKSNWKREKLGKVRHQRNVHQRHKSTEHAMDLSKLSLPRLRKQLQRNILRNPLEARNNCICLLIISNFSRVGELANMTLSEVDEAKEVGEDYFCVEVENHKTAASMGPAPILLSAQDLTTVRNFIHQCRHKISPTASMVDEVFTTSTGAPITPSHMNKIILSGLGGSASSIRKALAGRYMYEGAKFTRALSNKMQHSQKTHAEWYEGHARRADMLVVVKQINKDFSTNRETPSASATITTADDPEGMEAPTSATAQAPAPSSSTTAEATTSQQEPPPSPAPSSSSSSDEDTGSPQSPPAPAEQFQGTPEVCTATYHEEVDMSLIDDVPDEIKDWYKPETTRLKKRDIPTGTRVKWTQQEHMAIHKFFGKYRGTSPAIRTCVRPIMKAFPECSKMLKGRTILEIRDKIRSFAKRH